MLETLIRYRDLLCDFCGSSNPCVVYEADDFSQRMSPGDENDNRELHMQGAWNACEECKELIEENKSEELVERALEQYGISPKSKVYEKLKDRIEVLHDEFYFSMTGQVTNIEDYVDPEGTVPGVVRISNQ